MKVIVRRCVLIDLGFNSDSVIAALDADDLSLLRHAELYTVPSNGRYAGVWFAR